jgi:hypothetical protein
MRRYTEMIRPPNIEKRTWWRRRRPFSMPSRQSIDTRRFLIQIFQSMIDILQASLMASHFFLLLRWKIRWHSWKSQPWQWLLDDRRRRCRSRWLVSSPTRTTLVRFVIVIVTVSVITIVVFGNSPTRTTLTRDSTAAVGAAICVGAAVVVGGTTTFPRLRKSQVGFAGFFPSRPVQDFLPETRIWSILVTQGFRFLGGTHEPILHDNMFTPNGGDQLGRFFTVLAHFGFLCSLDTQLFSLPEYCR